ncbi:MAG: hypothetical protein NT045_07175, partial [Candidatus Aureabacteria bacterium]|nr:hypothetical protein [Candidatus Auribacterota bacterium]
MNRPAAIIVSAVIALCPSACGRRTVILENRFAKGAESRYSLTSRGSGTSRVSGIPGQASAMESPFTVDLELTYRTLVKEVDPSGAATIEVAFERFISKNESGGMRMRIEADAKGARLIQGETVTGDAPGLDGLKAFFKNPTILKMDRRGQVLSVAQPSGVAAILPTVDLGNMLRQGQFLLPEKPVALRSSWRGK